jgi:hypothetical protein
MIWQPCTIESYDSEKRTFTISTDIRKDLKIKKEVSRLNMRYSFENEKEYEGRIELAKQRQKIHESILRYAKRINEYDAAFAETILMSKSLGIRILKRLT